MRKNLLALPKYINKKSQNHFLFNGIKIWNKYNQKVLQTSTLNEKLKIVIPGSESNSDFSTPVQYIKKKLKEFLLNAQSRGDDHCWEENNFVF